MYPIVQGSSRVALKDVILPKGGGDDGKSPVFAAAGTLVIFHFLALHKRKDLWGDDAETFRPERWHEEKASWVRFLNMMIEFSATELANVVTQHFLPFGGGPRNCIGRKYCDTGSLVVR